MRRIKVTTNSAEQKALQDPLKFKLAFEENQFSHVYEISTDKVPMADSVAALFKYYGNSLQDVNISEVTLEEVLGAHYATR